MSLRPVIGITCGEPAGIGPEIALRAAWQMRAEVNAILIGDTAFLSMIAAEIDPAIRLLALSAQAVRNDGLPQLAADRLIVIDNGKVMADGPKAQVVEALQSGRVGRAV